MVSSGLLARDWKSNLAHLFSTVSARLVIASPFITNEGTSYLLSHLPESRVSTIAIRLVTDLSPLNVCQASTDPNALLTLTHATPNLVLYHLPRLHAKVYVADHQNAIITSANLTAGGLDRNYEYGFLITSPQLVRQIAEDITEYSNLGAPITSDNLREYCKVADRLRTTFREQQKSMRKTVRSEFDKCVVTAEDSLVRLRLAGGAMHTVFAKTILYILRHYGPMDTVSLHPRIQQIHPDLCDDTIDRVIDGEHFGKKWKHAVRTAQQQLKKQGLVEIHDGVWRIVGAK